MLVVARETGVSMADSEEEQALASPPWQHSQDSQARSAISFSLMDT